MDRDEAAAIILERLARAMSAPLADAGSVAKALAKTVCSTLKDFEDDVRFSEAHKPRPEIEELRSELAAAQTERDKANDLYWKLKSSLRGAEGDVAGHSGHGRTGNGEHHVRGNGSEISGGGSA